MKRWPTKSLGEIATVQMGQSPPGNTYNSEGVGLPFFQGKAEFGEEHPTQVKWCSQPTRIAEAGDILLSVRAPVGPTNFAIERCCIGRGLAAIRGNPNECNQRYIRYYLKRFETDIAARGVGSTFTAINRNDVERLELPLPPLTEQERIVKLLDEADELRKLRAQADRRSADLIPALFHEMFGESIAFHKQWPTHLLGELIANGPQNGLYKHSSSYGDGVPILRIDAFYDGEVEDLSLLKRLRATQEEIISYGLSENDIVINRVNSPDYLGKSALIPALAEPTVFESNMMRFTVAADVIEPGYLIRFLQTKDAKRHILGRAKHSINQSSINQEDVKCIPILVPPLPLQQEFAQRVSEIRALQAAQAASRERTEHLFQSMLHRAFNQEL